MKTLSIVISTCIFVVGVSAQALPDTLTVTSATPPPYQANLTVQTSGTVTVNGAGTTTYSAGQQVVLMPGFTAVASSGTTPTFIATIAAPPLYPDSLPAGVTSSGGQNFYVTANGRIANLKASISNLKPFAPHSDAEIEFCEARHPDGSPLVGNQSGPSAVGSITRWRRQF